MSCVLSDEQIHEIANDTYRGACTSYLGLCEALRLAANEGAAKAREWTKSSEQKPKPFKSVAVCWKDYPDDVSLAWWGDEVWDNPDGSILVAPDFWQELPTPER